MSDRPTQEPVPVKPAATVMLVRDRDGGDEQGDGGGAGVEVFMLRRTLNAVFGSGMYVFPGGKVETHDGEDVERAHRLAAIRECFEEAGVLLARDASGAHVSDGHPALEHRTGVHAGDVDLLELCDEHGLTPAIDELAWVAHWITPKGEGARRFDTRFYLAPAPAEQHSVHDDNETIASMWVAPEDALARCRAGELTMMPPTIANLEFLAGFDSVDAALTHARAMPAPPCILPKIVFVDGKIAGIKLPGEPGYDDIDD
jgi:8-oxo-dGTP pyrophosphatase MutT (NUDIX family)